MEAPTIQAVEAITMIATKRAVMVDLIDQLTYVAADGPAGDHRHHPSYVAVGPRPGLRSGSVTCSNCRMTYLPSAVRSASSEAWACDSCDATLD